MNKTTLIDILAVKTKSTKAQAREMLDASLETLHNTLAREEAIRLVGFGTLEVVKRAARAGRDPVSGQPMRIPARKAVRFRPGKELSERVV